MKVLLCLCVLVAVIHSLPVEKEEEKGEVKFAPVEVAEDHAGEEGVDLTAAEQFHYGHYGHYGHGGHGGHYGGHYGHHGGHYGHHGHGSYSHESHSSEYYG